MDFSCQVTISVARGAQSDHHPKSVAPCNTNPGLFQGHVALTRSFARIKGPSHPKRPALGTAASRQSIEMAVRV